MTIANTDVAMRQLTLRLPGPVHARARQVAKAKKISINALVRGLLEELDRSERERELRSAYETLGKDKGSDVEPFFDAQAEAHRGG